VRGRSLGRSGVLVVLCQPFVPLEDFEIDDKHGNEDDTSQLYDVFLFVVDYPMTCGDMVEKHQSLQRNAINYLPFPCEYDK
jgi:hypothetical protein